MFVGLTCKSIEQSGLAGAPAFDQAHLQCSSPAGIAAVTPADAVFAVAGHVNLSSAQDFNNAAQGNLHHLVKEGIRLFTYGKSSNANKPNQETGIRLHAASGKVSSQSHSGKTELIADQQVKLASMNQDVTIASAAHVLMTAQGASIRIAGGNISLHAPGSVMFKGSAAEWTGPQSSSPTYPVLPLNPSQNANFSKRVDFSSIFAESDLINGVPYKIKRADGRVYEGVLDQQGRTDRVISEKAEDITILVGDGDWNSHLEIYQNHDCGCSHHQGENE